MIIFIVGAVIIIFGIIFNIIVGCVFTIFSGGGVRWGLNEAVAVGNCGGEGYEGRRWGMPRWFGWDGHRKYHGGRCCCLLGGVREAT